MTYIDQIKTDWLFTLKRRILVVVALAMVGATMLVCAILYQFLLDEGAHAAGGQSILAQTVLSNLMIQRNPERIQNAIAIICAADPCLKRVLVLNNDGVVRYASDAAAVGARFDKLSDPSCAACHTSATATLDRVRSVTHPTGPWAQREAVAIKNQPACYGCHDASQRKLGALIIDYSFETTRQSVLRIMGTLAILSLVFLVGLGLFLSRSEDRYIRRIIYQGEELTSLYIMVERLSQTIDRKELDGIVVGIIAETLKASEVDMVTPREGGGHRRLTWMSNGAEPVRRKLETAPSLIPLVERWIVNPRFEPELADGGRVVIMPISKTDTRLALLVLRALANPIEPERLWLIRVMSDHIASAYENARLYTIAITDKLTGLYTRRHFEYSADRIFGECQKNHDPMALLMVDVDNFKSVNDTYGHVTGDALLEAIGGGILEVVRDTDMAFRYGGEEFAVVLPRTDAQGALDVAERLLAAMRAIHLEEYPHKVTVSVGLAAYPDHAETIHGLIQAADRALYDAKHAGKDRVNVYTTDNGR